MTDKATHDALREKYNPDGSMLRNVQMRMLEILIYIDKVCRENGIDYWLSSGTLLGAVRHGGFIPWDDDADVEMLKKDYDRLVSILEEKDDYFLQTYASDPLYYYYFAKLKDRNSYVHENHDVLSNHHGCWVDIFPLEKNCRFFLWLSARMYRLFIKNPYKHVLEQPEKLEKGKRFFYGKYVPFCSKVSESLPFRYIYHSTGSSFRKRRKAEEIFPLADIEFEGHKFRAPRNCDAYLKRIYGNYMSIPPAEKIKVHLIKAEIY